MGILLFLSLSEQIQTSYPEMSSILCYKYSGVHSLAAVNHHPLAEHSGSTGLSALLHPILIHHSWGGIVHLPADRQWRNTDLPPVVGVWDASSSTSLSCEETHRGTGLSQGVTGEKQVVMSQRSQVFACMDDHKPAVKMPFSTLL